MFILITKYCVIFVYISSIISVSDCFTTKHNKYKEYTIEDYKVCSPIANREIDLKKEEAALVTQGKSKDHTVDWSSNFLCKFSIESKTGLFAIVQHLNLRKDPITGQCIDWIKFSTKKNSHHEQLCGKYNVAHNSQIDPNFIAEDPYGYIQTTIYIGRQKLVNEETDFKIAYTKYKKCDATYKPCENNGNYCIHNELFNDSIVNCYADDCRDEISCEDLQNRLNSGSSCVGCAEADSNSTKIILSAVTSLVVSFVVFVICIWICKKTGKLCWGAGCAETTRSRPASRVIEMQNRTENPVQTSVASLPSPSDPEKDLPPSYDSLFPPR